MITSTANSQVKQAAALAKKAKIRKETGLFVVEGPKMFQEAPKEWIHKVYISESFLEKYPSLADGYNCETVTDDVMRAMADTQTPQGILAFVRQPSWKISDILGSKGKKKPLVMVLETLQDPGNLGTIIRAGEGAGVTGIVMNRETADIFSPKVIRSTMGAVYRVPFLYTDDLKNTILQMKEKGIRFYAAHLKGNRDYDEEEYLQPSGFMIGNESKGLSEELAAMADCLIKIPMEGQVESLNAAIAASVLMFEAARQRRRG